MAQMATDEYQWVVGWLPASSADSHLELPKMAIA